MKSCQNQDLGKTLQLLRDGLHNTIQSFRINRVEEKIIKSPFLEANETQSSQPSSLQEQQLINLDESYFENSVPSSNLRVSTGESSSPRKLRNNNRGRLNIHNALSQAVTKHEKQKKESSSILRIWKDVSDITVYPSEKNLYFGDEDFQQPNKSSTPNSSVSREPFSETFLAAEDTDTDTTSVTTKDIIIENKAVSFITEESWIKMEDLDQDDTDDIEDNASTYFKDGIKKVDYVLVYNKKNTKEIESYLNNIRSEGLDLEKEESKIYRHLIFVKLHATKGFLKKMESKLHIKWSFRNPYYFEQISTMSFRNTSLISPRGNDQISERAPQLLPTDVTNAERIMAVYKLLTETQFGKQVHDFGLEKMIENKIMVCAFPMHDKMLEWSSVGMLSDRQLLNKYWANFNCFLKVQPKQLINKYFGNEIAFYFAWLGFYTEMLVPAVILGLIVLLYGLLTVNNESINEQSYEISKLNISLCPVCQGNCFYSVLSDSYEFSKLSYVLDNGTTSIFNILMSFWVSGVTFLILWKQKERFFKIVWNLSNVKVTDSKIRANFYALNSRKGFTTLIDIDKYKKRQSNWWYFFSIVIMVLCTTVIINIIFGLLITKMNIIQFYGLPKFLNKLNYKINYNKLKVEIVWSVTTIIFVTTIDSITPIITYYLTNYENPKTEREFEKSYILKLFMLTIVTNYSIPIYLAFFRGTFYIPPSKINKWEHQNLKHDLCDPSGCMVSLACWITTNIIFKLAKILIVDFVAQKMIVAFKSLSPFFNFLTEWEKNYTLISYRKTQLIQLYIENIIQYGFIVCFVTACPLIPFMIWVSNAIKIRLYAIKLIRYQKRPNPTVMTDLGIWNKILTIMTCIGILIHIFFIAFTTELIPKFLFYIQNWNFENYMKSKLTDFYFTDTSSNKSCEFVGYRNSSSLDYAPIYFKIIAAKLIFTTVMEHLVIIIFIILTLYIPVLSKSMIKYFNQL